MSTRAKFSLVFVFLLWALGHNGWLVPRELSLWFPAGFSDQAAERLLRAVELGVANALPVWGTATLYWLYRQSHLVYPLGMLLSVISLHAILVAVAMGNTWEITVLAAVGPVGVGISHVIAWCRKIRG